MEDQTFKHGSSTNIPVDEYMRNVKFEVKRMEEDYKRKKEQNHEKRDGYQISN